MEKCMIGWEMLRRFGQRLGPYLVLEIGCPGGTLLALLLFLYRRAKLRGRSGFIPQGYWRKMRVAAADSVPPVRRIGSARCRFQASPNDYGMEGSR